MSKLSELTDPYLTLLGCIHLKLAKELTPEEREGWTTLSEEIMKKYWEAIHKNPENKDDFIMYG